MRKILLFICCLFGVLALASCSGKVTEEEFTKEKSYLGDQFTKVCTHSSNWGEYTTYLCHKDTNVMYIYIRDYDSNTRGKIAGLSIMYNDKGEIITKDTFSNYHTHDEE